MKRVLALHGHFHSARVLRNKLHAIAEMCRHDIEFVFLDAPHILDPVNELGEWLDRPSTLGNLKDDEAPRAWWRCLAGMQDQHNVEYSFKYLKEVLETQGPFHGILGFSQGASVSGMLIALLETPGIWPDLVDEIQHPPFEFGILFSGYRPSSSAFLLPRYISTPTLHIMGYNDVLVPPEWTIKFATHFVGPQVEMHGGGHWIPNKAIWRHFLSDYLKYRAALNPMEYSDGSDVSSDTEMSFPKTPPSSVTLLNFRREVLHLEKVKLVNFEHATEFDHLLV